MKKELLVNAGVNLFGENWVSPLADDLKINRKTIQRYNSGEIAVNQNIAHELVALLSVRKAAIENTINAIESDYYIDEKVNLTKTFVVVSEGGHLLGEQFKTLEDAKAWVNNEFEIDDQYLISYHTMTVAEQYALETMQHYSDVCDPKKVLQAIKSGEFSKTEQEYCLILCELDDNHLGREYYAYFIASEFGLGCQSYDSSDEPDFDFNKTISYKQFIMKRIAELSKYVAINF